MNQRGIIIKQTAKIIFWLFLAEMNKTLFTNCSPLVKKYTPLEWTIWERIYLVKIPKEQSESDDSMELAKISSLTRSNSRPKFESQQCHIIKLFKSSINQFSVSRLAIKRLTSLNFQQFNTKGSHVFLVARSVTL